VTWILVFAWTATPRASVGSSLWGWIMTVAELIEELKKLPPESEVILQKDAEGNEYSPLSEVDGNAIYTPNTTWSGEVFSTEWSADDACYESEEEWESFKASNPRCCVLAPLN